MNSESPIKHIVSYLPIIFPLILIFSVIKQIVYFSYFNVDIGYFLDLQEVINLLFTNAWFMFYMLLNIVLFSFFSLSKQSEYSLLMKTVSNKSTDSKKSKSKRFTFFVLWGCLGVFLFLFYFRINIDLLESFCFLILMVYIIGTLSFIFAFVLVNWYGSHELFGFRVTVLFRYVIGLVFFLYCAFFFGRTESILIKFGSKNHNVNVYFNNNTQFSGNDSAYYIGNMNDFIFIYNEKSDITKAIKIESVDSISFGKSFSK